jgi:Protein of unknown function (DUF4241)
VSVRPPDFTRFFAEGSTHDLSRVRDGREATVRLAAGAELWLPTGRLVAAEPWSHLGDSAESYAFTQRVAPGTYPVELIIAGYHDPAHPRGRRGFDEVAAARLVIRDAPAVSWRLALREAADEAQLADDEYYGYPVDGGNGSFGSPEVFDAIARNEATDDLVYIAGDLERVDEVGVYADKVTGTNLVMFRSGGGDGCYATWVGYTAEGEVACFVTDFGTLTDGLGGDFGATEPQEPATPAPEPARSRRRGPRSHAAGAHMRVGQTLSRRQTLTSHSGEFILAYQDDGNLVLYPYDQDRAVWASNTQFTSVGECVLQEDGNLVIYDREGRAVWASGTNGSPAIRLTVRDGGFLTLESATGEILWSTGRMLSRGTARGSAR